jgi:hypothetical protein
MYSIHIVRYLIHNKKQCYKYSVHLNRAQLSMLCLTDLLIVVCFKEISPF